MIKIDDRVTTTHCELCGYGPCDWVISSPAIYLGKEHQDMEKESLFAKLQLNNDFDYNLFCPVKVRKVYD